MSLTSLVQGPIFLFLKGNDRSLNSHKTLLIQQQYCISFHVLLLVLIVEHFCFQIIISCLWILVLLANQKAALKELAARRLRTER